MMNFCFDDLINIRVVVVANTPERPWRTDVEKGSV